MHLKTNLTTLIAVSLSCTLLGCDPGAAEPEGETAPGLDKVRFVFQKQKDPSTLKAAADYLGEALSERLGVPVEVTVPGDYSTSVQALVSGTTDVAYVSSLPFLLARRDGDAQLILAEQRDDTEGNTRTEYDSLMVVREDSPIQSIDDLKAQAGETRYCFTSPTSTSGYVFARLRLVREGILEKGQDPEDVFGEVSFGGGYAQALREVVNGNADVAAVSFYTMEGPKADVYLTPEERGQLRILARTPGVPTHVVCVRDGINADWQQKIREALLAVAEENPDLLSDVYGTARFIQIDEDAHVAPAIEAVEAVGLPLEDLNKK